MGSDSVLPLAISSQIIPVIDFSDKTLKPGSSKWDEVKIGVRKALEDYGCFEASFDKVSVELKKSVLEAMKELFELPTETKQRNVYSKPFRGYVSLGHFNHQGFGIDDATVLDQVYDFTQQLWPDHGNKSISETMHLYSEQLSELEVMVKRMIMESFGIEKYLNEQINSTYYMLRLLEYTVIVMRFLSLDADIEETKLGFVPHTDKNLITILHQSQDGLEVKTKDEKWIKLKPSQEDSFIVMALMNGRVFPPCHRVVMEGKKTRYSTALFSQPKTGVIINTPEELVDEEHPRLFKPYDYDEFVEFFHTEAGRRTQSAIHAFAAH